MKSKFDLLYEQVMKSLLKEGGHAFDGVSPILKENIKDTIEYLKNIVFIPLNIDDSLWTSEIGSVGKKDQSGDIDIDQFGALFHLAALLRHGVVVAQRKKGHTQQHQSQQNQP